MSGSIEAHAKLDDIVESCYPDYPFASDETRLEYLFKLYEKMTMNKKKGIMSLVIIMTIGSKYKHHDFSVVNLIHKTMLLGA